MLQIQRITNNALQQQTLVLPNGKSFSMTMYFVPMQYGWFLTNITYGTFILNGLRITNNPNMLYQWQNKIPFGLGCFSTANREPSQQDDFSSGASKLYILTQAECVEYATYISGGALPA
jgi:hypothetical protein